MRTRLRAQLEIKGGSQSNERAEGGVWPLGREESADGLRLDLGPARQLGLGQAQLSPSRVEGADDRVDLLNALSGGLVRRPVLGIIEPFGEVALRSGA